MKYKAITIVRDFFEATLQEMKELTSLDRQQLASAIARQRGYTAEECEFALVEY